MFDRKTWEKARPILARGSGLGAAADGFRKDCKNPASFTTYAEFLAARAAVNAVESAIAIARKKLSKHPSNTAEQLVDSAEDELKVYRRDLGDEYAVRVERVKAAIKEVSDRIDDEEPKIRLRFKEATELRAAIDSEIKDLQAGEQVETERDGAKGIVTMVQELREETKSDFDRFRKQITDHEVRSSGVSGVCTNNAVGDPEKKDLANVFKGHMKTFGELERLIDDVLQEQNACVMGLKTLIALLDGRKNAIEKQIKVFAAVVTGLEKLYEPMGQLTSKAINIEGGGNFRAQAGYADGYNREQLDNDLAGVETGIDAYTTRLGQLVNLEEKASQIIQKLFDGVPDEIRDRATIVAMIDDVQKKWDKVRQDSESARERLTAAINRGGELVTYLKGRIKAISR